MNSSFGTIAGRHRPLRFRLFLVSEPAANQLSTNRFEELETSTTTDCRLLKQPDNQKLASLARGFVSPIHELHT